MRGYAEVELKDELELLVKYRHAQGSIEELGDRTGAAMVEAVKRALQLP